MKLKDGILINKIDNEYILVDIGLIKPTFSGMIKLNETGKDIVELLKEETSVDEIVKTLLEKYEVDKDILKNDVNQIIKELEKNNLIIK